MMSDIDKVVRALVANLDEPPYPASGNELSPILCVLTVLLSLDKRKRGYVEERIDRLQSPNPGYGTLAGIRDYAGAFPAVEQYFLVDPRDDGKRAGLFLPLLDRLIDELRDFSGATESDKARAWAVAARPSDWTFLPFRGLGLKGFQHLRQLLGANTVVPTKEFVAFVGRAVGRELEATEAVYLLEKAAGRLKYDLQGIPENGRRNGVSDTPEKGLD
jgi:hypothetical protein